MKIGLYSEIAHRQIPKINCKTSPDNIRRYREEIINMNFDIDSEIMNIVNMRDFYSLSECRDLLFHVQEHRFTLLQLYTVLNDLGLKFLGFEMKQSTMVMNKFKKIYPQKHALTSLPMWHKFELKNPDTFIGMYQFWVQKA